MDRGGRGGGAGYRDRDDNRWISSTIPPPPSSSSGMPYSHRASQQRYGSRDSPPPPPLTRGERERDYQNYPIPRLPPHPPRYRSPPPLSGTPSNRDRLWPPRASVDAGWDRERERDRGWGPPSSATPSSTPGPGRRPYLGPASGSARGFDVPYRDRERDRDGERDWNRDRDRVVSASRKRARHERGNSSDEEDGRFGAGGRSRPPSPPGGSSSVNGRRWAVTGNASSHQPPVPPLPFRDRERYRRPLSPPASTATVRSAPELSPRPQRRIGRDGRSYSPGEISEPESRPPRSRSPSRSRSSGPPTRSQSQTPPLPSSRLPAATRKPTSGPSPPPPRMDRSIPPLPSVAPARLTDAVEDLDLPEEGEVVDLEHGEIVEASLPPAASPPLQQPVSAPPARDPSPQAPAPPLAQDPSQRAPSPPAAATSTPADGAAAPLPSPPTPPLTLKLPTPAPATAVKSPLSTLKVMLRIPPRKVIPAERQQESVQEFKQTPEREQPADLANGHVASSSAPQDRPLSTNATTGQQSDDMPVESSTFRSSNPPQIPAAVAATAPLAPVPAAVPAASQLSPRTVGHVTAVAIPAASSPLSQLAPTSPPPPPPPRISSPATARLRGENGVDTHGTTDDKMDLDDVPPVPELDDEARTLSPSTAPGSPPPRDFASVLGSFIASNKVDLGEANAVVVANRVKTANERAVVDKTKRDAALDKAFRAIDRESHERLCVFLLDEFAARDEARGRKMLELRDQYRMLHEDWRAHCKRLDRIKERIVRRNQPTSVPQTPSIDSTGLPFYPEPLPTPGPTAGIGRANRRNTNNAFGYGDAVRSEAEFLEILASLETADMRDPTVRATRTAAVVPDMVIGDVERRHLLALDDESRRVDDPVDFFGIETPMDLWTEEEVQIFCKRYSQHPKQFGKISADLPNKTTAQCVLFYYRMKTTIDFRSLSDRRNRDGRRRKPKKRTLMEIGGSAKKGSSLLANLKRDQGDEDDDDSPPPSPQLSRQSLPAESPSVFQPPPPQTPRPASSGNAAASLEHGADGAPDDSSFYFTPGPPQPLALPKEPRQPKTPKQRDAPQLPSDGMLEAAEALGALVGGFVEGAEETPDERSRAGVNGKPKRRSNTSSYWSVAERTQLVRLLGIHGKDWAKLSAGLQNKTAVQCRNWYQSNAKKLNLAEIAENAAEQYDDDDADGATHSALATPGAEFTAPLGVPLSESLNSNSNSLPRTGFFLPDQSLNRMDVDEKVAKAGMPIRNLLNDDSHNEEVQTPGGGEDWFGTVNGDGDAGSATTEDESETPLGPPKSLAAVVKPDPFANLHSARRSSEEIKSAATNTMYRHPLAPSPAHYTGAYPQQPLLHVRQAMPSPLTTSSWQSSPSGTPVSSGYPSPVIHSAVTAGAARRSFEAAHYGGVGAPAAPVHNARSGSQQQQNDYFNSQHHAGVRPFSRTSAYPPAPSPAIGRDTNKSPGVQVPSLSDRPRPPSSSSSGGRPPQ